MRQMKYSKKKNYTDQAIHATQGINSLHTSAEM